MLAGRRQDQHPRRRVVAEHVGGHLDAAGPGDLEVEHHDLRPRRREAGDRLVAVGGHGDHVEPGVLQVALDRVAPHRVVVDDHHPQPRLACSSTWRDRRTCARALHARTARGGDAAARRRRRPRGARRPWSPGSTSRPPARDSRRTPAQVVADASRGPHSVASNSACRNIPPGRRRRPGEHLGQVAVLPRQQLHHRRAPTPSSRSVRSASGSSSASTRASSPAATRNDVTVSPARPSSSPASRG